MTDHVRQTEDAEMTIIVGMMIVTTTTTAEDRTTAAIAIVTIEVTTTMIDTTTTVMIVMITGIPGIIGATTTAGSATIGGIMITGGGTPLKMNPATQMRPVTFLHYMTPENNCNSQIGRKLAPRPM